MKPDGQTAFYQKSPEIFEKLYNMLLDTIPSSVLMIDRELRILSANRNFLEKSKRSIVDTIGYRLEEIFPFIIVQSMNIAKEIRQVFNTNLPSKGQRMSFRSPGIPMRIYYYRIMPFIWDGTVDSVMLLMDDVTEQINLSEEVRRVERHLTSIFESASDIMLSTDVSGRILSWNPAAEKTSGYTFKEVKNQFFYKFCTDDCQETVKKIFSEMKSLDDSIMADWNLLTKNGTYIHVSWVYSPMKDPQSRTVGIVVVGRDHSERHKMEMQLYQSQKFAALGVMAGGIAHEIRNPLTICSSAAQFLSEDDILPDFRKECAEKIYLGIHRVSAIIENLLKFARPPAKSEEVKVNILELITETFGLLSNHATIQKIEIKMSFPDKPVYIRGNTSLLQQVFINIFLNSLNAMPNRGVLSVCVNQTGDKVLISVTDTGHGICKENINKIYDPFFTTSPVGQGTGLGLSICYSIIKQHSGSIEVDSVEGKGTTFIVTLPAGE